MIGDVPIVFIYRIAKFFSNGGDVSFSNYFYQHFLGDKWDKDLKLHKIQKQDTF